MPDIILRQPDTAELEKQAAPMVVKATALAISNRDDHAVAQTVMADNKRYVRRVKEELDPLVDDAHRVHKGLTSLRSRLITPAEDANRIIAGKLDVYETEQKRLEDAERLRLEGLARKDEEDRQLMEAIAAQEAGELDVAAAILEQPVTVAAVHVPIQTAKVEGMGKHVKWGAEVVDKMALDRYVASHPEWSSLTDPNMPNLNRLAVAQREAMSIPGVKAVAKTVRTFRDGGE